MLQGEKILVSIAASGKEAMEIINSKEFDGIILDYTLPDISGADLLQQISKVKHKLTPIIVYSAKDFNKKEMNLLNQNSSSILLKGVNSIEYLLEETIGHLHINHKNLSPDKRKIIENIRRKEEILVGKNVLVVDDDVRNLFALTTVFE
jgi:DNA-binding response OmpR family regulator